MPFANKQVEKLPSITQYVIEDLLRIEYTLYTYKMEGIFMDRVKIEFPGQYVYNDTAAALELIRGS